MELSTWANGVARTHLAAALPRRWAHTQGVASTARGLAPILGDDAGLLEAAAWLHDVGYAPNLVRTGFHPLDGARYLREAEQAPDLLCRLVAHHTCAAVEAEERGLADQLAHDFARPRDDLAAALTFCDITTAPDGQPLSAEERLAEIFSRYGPDHLVTRAMTRAAPQISAAVADVVGKLVNALFAADPSAFAGR